MRRNWWRLYFKLTKKQFILGGLVGFVSGVYIYKPIYDEIRKEKPEVLVGTVVKD